MTKADELYARASRVMPGGVTASARINKSTGKPFFMSHGQGGRVYDLDGREYVDLCTSFGAALLGHGHPRVKEAIIKGVELGLICSSENEYQTELAEKLVRILPCADMVRFTISGTETTWYVIRLAREFTGRQKIVKIEGHFHGFNDYLQFNYWPPLGEALPNIREEAPGSPGNMRDYIIVLPFNDPVALEETLTRQGHEIAAVILEPLNYNSGGIRPQPGYLQLLRRLTQEQGIVLIFDEILSGFRTGPSCMQGYFGVTPDLCTVGKALGGGTALSAYAGKAEIMRHVAPLGKAMHSGTYNANLINILAGIAFVEEITQPGFYESLLPRAERLYRELNAIFQETGLHARVQGTGARFNILFGAAADRELVNYRDAALQDWGLGYRFFGAALEHGVYFHTMWHHGISSMHTDDDLDHILEGVRAAAREVAALKIEGSQEVFSL